MILKLEGPLLLAGAGKMGGALLAGWLERGLSPSDIIIQDPAPASDTLESALERGVRVETSVGVLPKPPSVIVVAVKPQVMEVVFPLLARLAGPRTMVLSIAAGKTIASFERHLAVGAAVVRAMPNTPAAIGRGITVCCANPHVSAAQRALCDQLLAAVGTVAWITDEGQMDAVTAVSGSGPAYVFHLVEAMAAAGEAAGLAPDLAMRLARETVSGAGELLHRSDQDAGTLRHNVTSPGGTTAAALAVLMADDGLAALMRRAVAAATIRGRELAK